MKPISDQLFAFTRSDHPTLAYERCSAGDLGLRESWLRDAIFENPDLVIGPCRAAGLTDDEWYAWKREYGVEVGSIDVLLLSAQGRIAVVETKLASNPDLRRRVLAQALDYLAHLSDAFDESMPELPKDESGEPVADREDVRESVRQRDVLVIIASDAVDSRVANLSRTLLSDNLVKQWGLALIDLALFKPAGDRSGEHIVVPTMRNLVESDARQVVRVIVEGKTPSARVEVERIDVDLGTPTRRGTSARQKWDEAKFFKQLATGSVPEPVRKLAYQLRDLVLTLPDSIVLAWGTGKQGCMVVKRNDGGLIEVYGSGQVRFRPPKFSRALGTKAGSQYRQGLEQILAESIQGVHPRLAPADAAKVAPALFNLLKQALAGVERRT